MPLKPVARLLACLVLCVGVGFAGSLYSKPEIPTWYAGLAKPFWTPPPLAFPIVWTTLYVLMAVALWRLWDCVPASPQRSRAIGWFAVQLVLNATWSPVFFGWHGIRTAMVIIVLMVITIAATIRATATVDRGAAWLLAPYLLWVLYASTINAGVIALN